MALQLRRKYRLIANPSLLHFSSFSSSPNPPDPFPENPSNGSHSPDSSQFNDVKANLKHQTTAPRRPTAAPPPFSRSAAPPPSKAASLDEISRNLSNFRIRTAPPPPATASSPPPISFHELYKKNLTARSDGNGPIVSGQKTSYDTIRQSLKNMQNHGGNVGSKVVGGSKELPLSVFGKEMGEKKHGGGGERSEAMRTGFVTMYNYNELGEKLRSLRPEGVAKGGFCLSELNERLKKLREIEEVASRSDTGWFKDVRAGLETQAMSDVEKAKKTPIQRLNVLGGLVGTPDYMTLPPKDHLVEKYFHPDNMSSAEKLKLELQNVREEFKMSESDCGSARVQVAQLTTKIKHLSTVLHKKDKHSRKGLVEMVQRRKKLLKYLRRTDWDSYCFVLSKLGLRDNPDYKR